MPTILSATHPETHPTDPSTHRSGGDRVPFLLSLLLVGTLQFGVAHDVSAETDPAAAEFFEKEVRPLLVDSCLRCHGEKKQESGLRLDSRAALLSGGVSGPALETEQLDDSLLLEAIGYQSDIRMPPSGKLTDAQIAILTKWVRMGAPWPGSSDTPAPRPSVITAEDREFWSFQPVRNPPLPTVHNQSWAKTAIDRFILARWEQQDLTPLPRADKRTLLRRITFDLTGLPPTPAEIQEFLADNSPSAFDRVMDRLLASKHYGERWGRHWLDVVRYADTAGDGADYPIREAYKYRNYVVDSFNADKPYDQFLREQIAGDIIARDEIARGAITAGQYAEKVIATGYIAVTKRFGYNANSSEFSHLDISDTLETLGRSILGLSVGCARCHDHKYDPISAADYYALYGIFSSTKYAFPGGEETKRPFFFPPTIPPAEVTKLEQQRAAELAVVDAGLKQLAGSRQQMLDNMRELGGVDLAFELQTAGKPPAAPWFHAGPHTVLAEAQSPYTHVSPAGTQGLRMQHAQPHDGLRYTFTPRTAGQAPRLHFNLDFRNVTAVENGGAYRIYLGHGALITLAVECSVGSREFLVRDGTGWKKIRDLRTGTWYNLQLTVDLQNRTYSGTIGSPGDIVEISPRPLAAGWDGILDTFVIDGIAHVSGTQPTRDVDNLALHNFPLAALSAGSVVAPRSGSGSPTDYRRLVAEFDSRIAAAKHRRDQIATEALYPVAYGVSEGQPANAHLQKRGEPDKPGPEIPRHFLSILGGDPLPPDATGSGRLALADWLTRPSNPLTARVLVNRVWHFHFGRGLVPTPSDFGTRGEPPTHPDLLDYLTTRFIADGWSIKKLHREILRSAVYQLASSDREANLKADPANRLFWKFERRRLSAEEIRDSMLAVSGRLDRATPAGHPFPAVDTWKFTIHNPFHAVYDSNHRSIYLMVQRAGRHPFLALFDAADPNISTGTRVLTTTPTQALFLMNSPFVHEQSRGLAERLLSEASDDRARVALACELTQGQLPTASQIDEALTFVRNYQQQASHLTTAGNSATEKASRTAGWEALARVLLTSNGSLFVD